MTRISGQCIRALLALAAATATAQTVTSITPSTVSAGSKSFTLTVTGSNFDKDAAVELNGQTHETVPVSSTELKALVFAADVATPATILVTVINSNGSESNAVHLTVTGKSGTPPPPPPNGPVTVTIKSPSQNQTVCSPLSLSASATTSTSGAEIIRWLITDQSGIQLYSVNGVLSSVDPRITLAAGNYVLTVVAYSSAGITGTAKLNVTVTSAASVCGTSTPPPSAGPVTSFRGCLFTQVRLTHQAIDFTVNKTIGLPFNATLYYGSGCNPSAWADQFGFGQVLSFAPETYTYWFSDFPDQPDTSAIWTVGSQSSGCINYTSAPPC